MLPTNDQPMRVEQLATGFIVSENKFDMISGAADFFRCTLAAENNGNRFTIPRLRVIERAIVAGGAGTTIKIDVNGVVVHTLQLDENGECSLAPHGNLLLNDYIHFLEVSVVPEDMQLHSVRIVGLIARDGLSIPDNNDKTAIGTKMQIFDGLAVTPTYYVEVGNGEKVRSHYVDDRLTIKK